MSIPIKVPVLPFSSPAAEIGYWYRKVGDVIARGEVLVELKIRDNIVQVPSPQAGVIERIVFQQNQQAAVGEILAYLKTGLPDLVWDGEQQSLMLETYHAEGVTAGMEYDLRQMLRSKTKFGSGFGSALAVPQFPNEIPNYGQDREMSGPARSQFKSHPRLQSPQFSGERAKTIPSTPEAQRAPENAPSLNPKPNLAPGAPAPSPSRR